MTIGRSDLADTLDLLARLCRAEPDIVPGIPPAAADAAAYKDALLTIAAGGVPSLQRALGVEDDGIVGPITRGALVAIQIDALLRAIAEPPPAAPSVPAPPETPPGGSSPIPPAYRVDYNEDWRRMTIDSGRLSEIDQISQRMKRNAARYQRVADAVGVPYWPMIAIVHNLESGLDFSTHLHNGDPLIWRTVHVPAGRPTGGSPPFSWEESAIDALTEDQCWDKWGDWSTAGMAYLLEKYNGFGYRRLGVPSAYLWGGSNIYEKGKFISDGVFDSEAVSEQIGGMTMLKYFSDLTEKPA